MSLIKIWSLEEHRNQKFTKEDTTVYSKQGLLAVSNVWNILYVIESERENGEKTRQSKENSVIQFLSIFWKKKQINSQIKEK